MTRDHDRSVGHGLATAALLAVVVATLVACAPTTAAPGPTGTGTPGSTRAAFSPECSAAEQLITIPDPALAEALGASLKAGQPRSSEFTCAELGQLVQFRASGVESLAGLEFAINLNRLNINGSPVTSLGPLAGMTRLTTLYVAGGSLTSLEAVAELPALSVLDVDDNDLVDVSPLAFLPDLTWFSAAGNAITDISPLAEMDALFWLDLSDNRIVDISPLAGNGFLAVLKLSGNRIVDAGALTGLSELQRVELAGNRLTDVDFMEALELEILDVSDNRIASVTGLARNRSLSAKEPYDLRGNCIDLAADDPFLLDLLTRGSRLLLEPQDESCVE